MTHHRRGLRRRLKNDRLAAAIESDWRAAELDPRRRAILAYVEKLTRSPGDMRAEDLDPMRAEGLKDEDILAVAEVCAYYAYVNRIADGLGVAVEDDDSRMQ